MENDTCPFCGANKVNKTDEREIVSVYSCGTMFNRPEGIKIQDNLCKILVAAMYMINNYRIEPLNSHCAAELRKQIEKFTSLKYPPQQGE
jgi:hypothetical protein